MLFSSVAMLLIIMGCKPNDDKTGAVSETMSFIGRIDGGGSKTTIDGVTVKWCKDDCIRINGRLFKSEIEGDSTTAVFTGEFVDSTCYCAYYPASLKVGGKYALPATQTYDGRNLSGINPMYAQSNTTDLTFHNICALMKFVVKGDGIVRTITASADQPLSGEFEVVKEEGNGKYVARLRQSSKDDAATVTLDCGKGGVTLGADAKTFYIALPQGEYTNLKFKLCDGDGGIWESAPVSLKLTAGKIRTMELKAVSVVTIDGALKSVFSVSGTKKVCFSKGNLWYGKLNDAATATFNFEDNQWKSEPASNGMPWNPNHVSHFYWSKTADAAYAALYSNNDAAADDIFFTNATETTPNPDLTVNGTTGKWRVLSWNKDEWGYLLNKRTMTNNKSRYTRLMSGVTIDGIIYYGLFVYPDDYNGTIVGADATTDTWNEINDLGIVFFPAAGRRTNNVLFSNGFYGQYWSSEASDATEAYLFYFYDNSTGDFVGKWCYSREDGRGVRLVYDAN